MELKKLALFVIVAAAIGYLLWVFGCALASDSQTTYSFLSWWTMVPISVCVAVAIIAWVKEILWPDDTSAMVEPPPLQRRDAHIE